MSARHTPSAQGPDQDARGAPAPAARVSGLSVRLPLAGGRHWVHAAHEVDLELHAGRVHALVGESGCGKSVLASALIGLLPEGAEVKGLLEIAGHAISPTAEAEWEHLRGHHVGLVPQSAATLLTPTRRVGPQVAETLAALCPDAHGLRGRRLQGLVERSLAAVGLPAGVARRYPHELSGGMAARVAYVLATAGRPAVLLADEPTASLDAASREAVLDLLRRAADEGAAVLLITHDLASLGARQGDVEGITADGAEATRGRVDEVSVMYAGQVVDHGPADRLLAPPGDPGPADRLLAPPGDPGPHEERHPYTRALVAALPRHGLQPIPGAPPSLVDLAAPPSVVERLAASPTSRSTPTGTSTPTAQSVCSSSRSARESAHDPRRSASAPAGPAVRHQHLTAATPAVPDDDAATPAVRLEAVTAAPARGAEPVLQGLSLELTPGTTTAVTGPNGAGKSTLCRVVAGLADVRAGTVEIGGRPVRPGLPADGVAMLFQSPRRSVSPRMTLAQVIAEPLELGRSPASHSTGQGTGHGTGHGIGPDTGRGMGRWGGRGTGPSTPRRAVTPRRRAIRAAVLEAAAEVGLTPDLLTRRAAAVSDGQLQRAALARALVMEPAVLLADEATAMLDPATTASVVGLLRERVAGGLTVLTISHDAELLEAWCTGPGDRVLALADLQAAAQA